jgi:hypothetical protein
MLLSELLSEAITFKRISADPKRDNTSKFELDTLANDPSEVNVKDPFEDPELGADGDQEYDPFAEPEADDSSIDPTDDPNGISDDQAAMGVAPDSSSFSSFMGGSGSRGLGSASVATPRTGDPGSPVDDAPDEQSMGDDGSDEGMDQLTNKATEDPNKQGLLRSVKGARLVYKRETEDGTYEELWMYNSGKDFRGEVDRRREILSGTDIPPNKTTSEDGEQSYDVWTTSNAELLLVRGLPN